MKRVSITFWLCASVLVLVAVSPMLAHHSNRATIDFKKQVTLKGIVTRFEWKNPHAVIYMDVMDGAGKVAWTFEDVGLSQLVAEGVTRNTFKPGQEITAVANPARNGTPVGIVVKFVTSDGKEIMSRVGGGGNPLD